MAKINKVKIYDQWYDIEDSIHFLSNGTISTTASHYITESMNREDFPPGPGSFYGPGYVIKDVNNKNIGIVRTLKSPENNPINYLQLQSFVLDNDNTTENSNYLRLGIKRDGTQVIGVSNKNAWLTGIGAEPAQTDTGWLDLPVDTTALSTSGDYKIIYRKKGNLVQIATKHFIYLKNNLNGGSNKIIASLTTSLRPNANLGFSAITAGTNTSTRIFPAGVYSNGNLYIFSNKNEVISTTTGLLFNVTYFTDN